jgi:hypothetical protein
MARTAAVVGTATATRNAINRRQADKNVKAYSDAVNATYAQPAPQQYAPQQQQQYAPPPPQQQYAPPTAMPALDEDVITQLERLGALRAQGILTEEEFAAQKAKLLGY